MSISIYIATKPDWKNLIVTLLKEQYSLEDCFGEHIFSKYVSPHFDVLRDDVTLLAESGYVDGFYRDSYYQYFSSKLKNYSRDCIRLSLFSGKISEDDFANSSRYKELQGKYLGFYVLRPTFPNILGRSVISPKAMKNNDIRICTCQFETTALGLKFQVEGFPHSSQDTEIITCAETTLWAVMEYFGEKYSNYKPVLPSIIINQLTSVSYERQIPSNGLNVDKISYALKEFGFGTRIYALDSFNEKKQNDEVKKEAENENTVGEFERLLSCYVESGIPLVLAIENEAESFAHALLVVGRKDNCDDKIDNMPSYFDKGKNIVIYDYDSVRRKLVYVDDNRPVYQTGYLPDLVAHYAGDNPKACKVTHFIVPFYPKIYLEAFGARLFVREFLLSGLLPIPENSEIIVKVFLASSRSFKHELMRGNGVSGKLKSYILEKQLPKFIWLAEISTGHLTKDGMASGLMILDATEPNRDYSPLIVAAYEGNFIEYGLCSGNYEKKVLHFEPFKIYEHNLRSH